ncbi:MFS transporter [Cellulomonas sp. zg-ZUI222]|uniref:MFS transporter n=1 Tax=Cellulomonas TaxID=1707 RepID=UPI001A940533|nr:MULTISPECIES: MFS transporter [Cellulomonas]MBO0900987.1 MFS transporter [Cellulomonas sp. zg-ZUI22]MBO0921642.1 MFS transporter [Cellulomonas wangleii]
MYRYTKPHAHRASRPPEGLPPDEAGGFVRDAPTLLAYAALGCYTFWLYAFGPAVTVLRAELGFSYSVLGLYSVLWSVGAAAAGAGFAWVAPRVTRRALLWCSALGAVLAAALFTLGHGVPTTLVAAAVFGLAGTMLLTALQAILSDRHGARRGQALTEANIAAGASAVIAPLVLGALAAGVLGWRATFVLPAVVLAALWLRHRHEPFAADPRDRTTRSDGPLPPASWAFALLMALGSAIEFCLVYFGPQMLIDIGLSPAAAGTALGANYLGILIGRMLGARVTRRPGRSVALLHASLAVTAVGFCFFWLTDTPVVAVVGLFVCGVGVANLYPLALALTLDAARGAEDRANSRSQLLVGLVAAASPFVLGGLADRYGLTAAFVVEPVLIGASLLLLWAGLRASRRADGRAL